MSAMKILVTGGAGYVGSNLVRALVREGHAVRVFCRESTSVEGLADLDVEIVRGDITDPDAVDRAVQGSGLVYHLVSNFRHPEVTDEVCRAVNVGGTKNVLESCLRHKIDRLIHCSTIGVHGHVENPPANEDSPFNPGDSYQVTKLEAEQLAWFYHQNRGLPLTVVRPTSVYGPGDMRMLKMFRMIQKGTFFMLGPGNGLFHPVYITDLIKGFLLCQANRNTIGKVIIIGGDEIVTIDQLVRMVAARLGVKPPWIRFPIFPFYVLGFLCEAVCVPLGIMPPIYRRRVKFFVNHRAFDISRARAVLGYKPEVDLRTGIDRTIEWYRKAGYLK